MTVGKGWWLAERTGRVLLLGAVAFWWGLIVVPRLVSLAFPELLSPDALPRHLDPDSEGNLANAVSAIALLITSSLAFAMVRQAHDARSYWITTGGWAVLAVTAAYLAWEEVSEFHADGTRALGETLLGAAYRSTLWPVLLSPLIVTFVLAMAVFVSKGFPSTGSTGSGWKVRALLILGLTAWLLAVVQEVGHTFKPSLLTRLLEEALEFGGTLVIGLSAAIALRGPAVLRPVRQAQDASRQFVGRFPLTVWWMAAIAIVACVVALGAVAAAVDLAPLADARARAHVGTFHMRLDEEHSLVQELGVLPAPPARIHLRVANHDPQGRPGTMIWRVMEAGERGEGRILREGRMELVARDDLSWERIDFPPLVEAEGRPLALQLVSELGPGAYLQISATKTNRYEDGRLWVNGEPAWPDQNIEFAVYTAAGLTRVKLRNIWGTFTSDWRWPVLAVDAAIGMTLITFIPVLLVTASLRRRGQPAPGSLTNSS